MERCEKLGCRNGGVVIAASLLFSTGLVAPGLSAEERAEIHGASGDSKATIQRPAEEIAFEPVGEKPGVYSANVVGSPGTAGVYVVLVKMDKGAGNAPHTHPDEGATTIIWGKARYGLGDRVVSESSRIYGPGSVYYTPPNTPHYLTPPEGEVIIRRSRWDHRREGMRMVGPLVCERSPKQEQACAVVGYSGEPQPAKRRHGMEST
jgi:quercetin dioxygenase-like cupin family protein